MHRHYWPGGPESILGSCQLWIESFDEIRELFFDEDPLRRQAAPDEKLC